MPLFNKEKECLESIQSVLEQTYSNYELIIVDDGSTDSSFQKVEDFLKENLKGVDFKLIQQENSGVSVARNRGVEKSKYEYITFLDADDLWHPQFLEQMVYAKKVFPKAKWLGCNCEEFVNEPPKSRGVVEKADFVEDSYFKVSIQLTTAQSAVYTGSFIVERERFQKVGGYPTGVKHSEDYDLYFRLADETSLVWTAQSLFYYRQDASNKASKAKSIREIPPFVFENKWVLGNKENNSLIWKREFLVGLIVNWVEYTVRSSLFREGLKLELLGYTWKCRNTKILKKRVWLRVLPVVFLNLISNRLANSLLAFSFKKVLGSLK